MIFPWKYFFSFVTDTCWCTFRHSIKTTNNHHSTNITINMISWKRMREEHFFLRFIDSISFFLLFSSLNGEAFYKHQYPLLWSRKKRQENSNHLSIVYIIFLCPLMIRCSYISNDFRWGWRLRTYRRIHLFLCVEQAFSDMLSTDQWTFPFLHLHLH